MKLKIQFNVNLFTLFNSRKEFYDFQINHEANKLLRAYRTISYYWKIKKVLIKST